MDIKKNNGSFWHPISPRYIFQLFLASCVIHIFHMFLSFTLFQHQGLSLGCTFQLRGSGLCPFYVLFSRVLSFYVPFENRGTYERHTSFFMSSLVAVSMVWKRDICPFYRFQKGLSLSSFCAWDTCLFLKATKGYLLILCATV